MLDLDKSSENGALKASNVTKLQRTTAVFAKQEAGVQRYDEMQKRT
jgi:hypothetical protein